MHACMLANDSSGRTSGQKTPRMPGFSLCIAHLTQLGEAANFERQAERLRVVRGGCTGCHRHALRRYRRDGKCDVVEQGGVLRNTFGI